MQNPSRSKILIYDPYSLCGYYLAKNLLAKGYTIILFSNLKLFNSLGTSSELDLIKSIEFYDLNNGCENNFGAIFSRNNIHKIFYIYSFVSCDFIFEGTHFFDYATEQMGISETLDFFAKENSIEVIAHKGFHCTAEVLEGIINRIGDFLLNQNKRLYVNILNLDLIFCSQTEYVNILEQILTFGEDTNHKFSSYFLGLRDVFRILFEELGAEIEFCGKEAHERGVIVDYDEDFLTEKNISIPKIRLGNTLIKINDDNYGFSSKIFDQKNMQSYVSELQFNDFKELNKLIKSLLYQLFNNHH